MYEEYDNSETGWSRLRQLNYYRSALSLFFLMIFINGWVELFIPANVYNPEVFFFATTTYLFSSVLFMLGMQHRTIGLVPQFAIHVSTDILVILILMYSIGGVRSGLGMLLVISISMTSLFLPLRSTLFVAAATSLGLLISQLYTHFTIPSVQAHYVQTGLLGTILFAVAYLSSTLTSRLRQTEQLAEEQSQELESAVQMNEHIINTMRTGIMVVSSDGIVQLVNRAAKNLLSDAFISENVPLSKISPVLYDRFIEWQMDPDNASQKPIQQSHGLPDIQPGFSNIEPGKTRDARTLVFLEDASQLNQRFQQVKLASLGRLTASIAHEIRNPLAAIHHASQLLEEADLQPADAKLTAIINTQVNRLNSTVENVLQLSRQQRGTPEQLNIYEWLVNFREEYCASKSLLLHQFHIEIYPRDTSVLFDSSQLHQVIWNLCSNALYHSGLSSDDIMINIQGGFSIDSDQPYIDVIDNGRGIDAEVAQQIFEPFYTTSTDGTGLGLYITKEVVESNRAKINYIALPTGGTCFRISFIQKPTRVEAAE